MALTLFYGGTFDPVHAGHLQVARAARDALGAVVHLVPANDPPHRDATGANAVERAHMLVLATAGETGLCVDPRELERDGPSYTVDTLRALRAELGDEASLGWIAGDDSFRSLPTWHDWRALLELAHFVVALRPGHGLDDLPGPLAHAVAGRWTEDPAVLHGAPAGRLYRLALPPQPESASAIRRALAAGEAPAGLQPAVERYIRVTGLYGAKV
jgi:nicotinate-nucleotide adenylyltransferase